MDLDHQSCMISRDAGHYLCHLVVTTVCELVAEHSCAQCWRSWRRKDEGLLWGLRWTRDADASQHGSICCIRYLLGTSGLVVCGASDWQNKVTLRMLRLCSCNGVEVLSMKALPRPHPASGPLSSSLPSSPLHHYHTPSSAQLHHSSNSQHTRLWWIKEKNTIRIPQVIICYIRQRFWTGSQEICEPHTQTKYPGRTDTLGRGPRVSSQSILSSLIPVSCKEPGAQNFGDEHQLINSPFCRIPFDFLLPLAL